VKKNILTINVKKKRKSSEMPQKQESLFAKPRHFKKVKAPEGKYLNIIVL
jgi:hypothetical protein